MSVKIQAVQKGSPADRSGILAGESLISINGHPIRDLLDYRFYMTERHLALMIDAQSSSRRVVVRKGEYEDLGLEFESYLMDRHQRCRNNCIFCFIDQLPPGMRESLYFKDDDSRLSFLFGNYITLTNLRQEEIERIIAMHISPINISVHTGDPELRVRMMRNPQAGPSLDAIARFAQAGIMMNTQIVLCPGINDGEQLERTLHWLSGFYPAVQSVACVPVGLTGYREGLFPLRGYTPEEAAQTIDLIERFSHRFLQKTGDPLARPADEFFLKAGRPIPEYAYYGEFDQLENGVGMAALLEHELECALKLEEGDTIPRRCSIVTGEAAAPLIERLIGRIQERFSGLHCSVYKVKNHFFGGEITVAGLLTGKDILAQLKGRDLGEKLLFPASMLRHDRKVFLDDMTPDELAKQLETPVFPVEVDGGALLESLLSSGQ